MAKVLISQIAFAIGSILTMFAIWLFDKKRDPNG